MSGVASAQGGNAASADAAEAPAFRIVGRYTVKPGQSLHDIAVELTQSHDKGVLARVSHALFDANPNAFTRHDPSRLKIGALLNVPDVPGVVVGEPQGASVPAPASASTTAPAAASAAKVTAPSAPVAPAMPSAPARTAQGAPAVAAATPSVAAAPASAVARSSTPLPASVPSAAVSAPAGASATIAATAPAAASGASAAAVGAAAQAAALAASGASASVAGSQPAAATSPSDAHVWSGAIQAAPAASAASGAALAQGASTVKTPLTVSSLQQLLALKNRVLMALQKHGIGQSAQPATAGKGTSANVAGAPGTKGAAGIAGPRATGAQVELSTPTMAIVAGVVAALLVLIFGLLMGRRKKSADKAVEAMPERDEPPVPDTPLRTGEAPSAEPRVTGAPEKAPAVSAPARRDETLDHAARTAGLSAAASLGGDALPPAQFDSPPLEETQSGAEHGATARGVERGAPRTLADASEVASFAAAAELGASALPVEPVEARRTEGEAEKLAREAELEHVPGGHDRQSSTPDRPEHEDAAPEAGTPRVVTEPQAPAPQAAEPQPAHLEEPAAAQAADAKDAGAGGEFPPDAVSALGGIDMPLPPRVANPVMDGVPLSTEPVASPGATAAQAVPPFDPPAPPAGEAIAAGTAGPGAIAGLAAPRFGALTLDFDLDLPPDSAEPLPVFTPEQLARIARNKLELAHEYVALGDLAGARALINEVIDSNDHATRADAQALLSTLAPLS